MADLHDWNSDEFLGFNLKLLGKKSKKNVLVSAGKLADKERMFSALQKLSHQTIRFSFTHLQFSKKISMPGFFWVKRAGLEHYAFPKTLQQFIVNQLK